MGILASLANRLSWVAEAQRIRVARSRGARLGPKVRILSGAKLRFSQSPSMPKRLDVGEGCLIEHGAILDPFGGSIILGKHVYVGPYSLLYGHGDLSIGHGTLIASHCHILSSNHSVPSAHLKIREQGDRVAPTSIGVECWLGAGVTVLAGVTVGDGVVIGAGSVVTRDIPPYAIAVGVPAIVRGWREDAPQAYPLGNL